MLDKKTGLLYIKKRSTYEVLTYIIFLFPFIMAFLLEFLHLPSFVKYSVDVMYLIALFLMNNGKNTLIQKEHTAFVAFVVSFLLYSLFTYLFNFQSPFYFLWGVRNNFRFYIVFLLYIVAFDEDDALGFLKLMDYLFWLNAIVSVFQFFILGYRQDFLGGIFGVDRGCNAYTILFFSIVIGKSFLLFMNKNESAVVCFTKCGLSLVIAAMAELKFYFVLFVLILLSCTAMTRFSFRKAFVLIVAAWLLMFSGLLLPMIFGEKTALTPENIWKMITATNYATTRDLGRFTAIPTIARDYLTDWSGRLFGMGLGNCDTSSFDICNSEFYKSHSYLNYNWFSSAFLFLETGIIGLLTYLSFFVICFVSAFRRMKRKEANELFCRLCMLMSVVCFIMVFYNSSLRTEIGYMAFFSLALPFVKRNQQETVI